MVLSQKQKKKVESAFAKESRGGIVAESVLFSNHSTSPQDLDRMMDYLDHLRNKRIMKQVKGMEKKFIAVGNPELLKELKQLREQVAKLQASPNIDAETAGHQVNIDVVRQQQVQIDKLREELSKSQADRMALKSEMRIREEQNRSGQESLKTALMDTKARLAAAEAKKKNAERTAELLRDCQQAVLNAKAQVTPHQTFQANVYQAQQERNVAQKVLKSLESSIAEENARVSREVALRESIEKNAESAHAQAESARREKNAIAAKYGGIEQNLQSARANAETARKERDAMHAQYEDP
jgi:chromosome segregation ATPase